MGEPDHAQAGAERLKLHVGFCGKDGLIDSFEWITKDYCRKCLKALLRIREEERMQRKRDFADYTAWIRSGGASPAASEALPD
jgi:hypothetical protein